MFESVVSEAESGPGWVLFWWLITMQPQEARWLPMWSYQV